MGLYELKKITRARERGYIINQINKLAIEIHSILSNINIHNYLKHRNPMCHRQFFRKLSQNRENLQTHCHDRRNLFHFACRRWSLYNNPQITL